MHVAAEYGNDLMVYMLNESGLDVNTQDLRNNSPLHVAVVQNKVHTVNFLLSLGADVTLVNDEGNTALHVSVLARNIQSCRDMLKRGANRNTENKQECTAQDLVKIEVIDKTLRASFLSALSKPWYSGCPMGRLPLMPLERNKRTQALFITLFAFIFLT